MIEVHPDFKELETFISDLPESFDREGQCIYKGRNELREFNVNGYKLVVKSYKRPNIINRFAYGFLRSSKAERAYKYGLKLQASGFGTPQPVGFLTCRNGFLLDKSYSVSMKSKYPYTYRDFNKHEFKRQDEILEAIARFTARLHENHYIHHDYSAGNILFDDSPSNIPIEIIDLNRMSFNKKISLEEGCRNFERLPGSDYMLEIMGSVYAECRGFNPEVCKQKIKRYVQEEIDMRLKRSH